MINNLVQISDNNQLTTTSLKIAERFGMEHKNVLRKIQALEMPADFQQLNFKLLQEVTKVGNGGYKKIPIMKSLLTVSRCWQWASPAKRR